jgi:signal transduction histidine kinase
VNSAPGQGSVFTIQLPLAEPAGAAIVADKPQTAP